MMTLKKITDKQSWKYFTQPLWLSSRKDISQSSKLVYGFLYQFLIMGKESVHPKISTISKFIGVSSRHVHNCVKELSKVGLLEYNREGAKGNIYTLFAPSEDEFNRNITSSGTNLPVEQSFRSNRNITSDDTPYIYNKKKNKKNICEVSSKLAPSSVIKSIFEHWQKVMSHPRAKLDNNRKNLIRIALEKDYTEDDLKLAIDGCSSSPYHMENNYDGLGLILRNAEKIEKFMGMAESEQTNDMFPDGKTAFQNCIARRSVPRCAENAYRLAINRVGGNRVTLNHMREEKAQAIFDRFYSMEKSKQRKLGDNYE